MPGHADIRALVRRLQGGSAARQAQAAQELLNLYDSYPQSQGSVEAQAAAEEAIAARIAATGGIPALLQLAGSANEHPGAAAASGLLTSLSDGSEARCQAIIAADGVATLVRCLESSSVAEVQGNAICTLAGIANLRGGGEAGAAVVVAAGAIPAAIRRLSSKKDLVSQRAALILGNLATTTPERRQAIAAAGAIPPLVRLLRRPHPDVAVEAAYALANLTPGSAVRVAAVEEAGGIPPLVELLATSSDANIVQAAATAVRNMLRFGPATIAAKVIEAGGIPAFVRCLQGQQLSSVAHTHAVVGLSLLAGGGAQPCRAIAEAGGIPTLVQALAWPCSSLLKRQISCTLLDLLRNGQAAAVAAADPTNAVAAALEALPSSTAVFDSPQARSDLAEAQCLLAAARVCSAPGCGATASLKRCAGCGSVRYCSEACMRAHWKEHRPECKRLRAAAAGEGAAGPSSSGQA